MRVACLRVTARRQGKPALRKILPPSQQLSILETLLPFPIPILSIHVQFRDPMKRSHPNRGINPLLQLKTITLQPFFRSRSRSRLKWRTGMSALRYSSCLSSPFESFVLFVVNPSPFLIPHSRLWAPPHPWLISAPG